MKTIFTATAVNSVCARQSFGFFETKEAWRTRNISSLGKGRFTHVVIEEWREGIGHFALAESWYKIREDGEWLEIDKPKQFDQIHNFAFSF